MFIKTRLALLLFFQIAISGMWLISIGPYMASIGFTGTEIGFIYGASSIGAILGPLTFGIIADKFINAEKLLGLLNIVASFFIFFLAFTKTPITMFWVYLVYMTCYQATFALCVSVTLYIIPAEKREKQYPAVRVFGTAGFIAAGWFISLAKWETSNLQFIATAAISILLGLYCFTLPKCPPLGKNKNSSISERLGLNAFSLLKSKTFLIFIIFSGFIDILMSAYFTSSGIFLQELAVKCPDFGIANYSTGILASSRISEMLFILLLSVLYPLLGIKKIVQTCMLVWAGIFVLFAFSYTGIWTIFLAMFLYGIGFDFCIVSGQMFIREIVPKHLQASAQGMFNTIVNGCFGYFGMIGGGFLMTYYANISDKNVHILNWNHYWLTLFSAAIIVFILFSALFKYRKTLRAA